MDTQQREFFERNGYLVVKNAIPLSLVERLNRDYDQKVREAHDADSELGLKPGQHNFRESRDHLGNGVRLWSQAWEELVDPPLLVPIIIELMNDDRFGHASPGVPPNQHRGKFRLDHDNIHYRPGQLADSGGALHTGYSGKECRLLSVVYELAPVRPGQGGFGCLPGSHRDDAPPLPTHEAWRKPGNWATDEQRGPLWPKDVPVHRIEANPDKYVPYGYHNRDVLYDMSSPTLTQQQRDIMAYPTEWYTPPWFGVERFEAEAPWLPVQAQTSTDVDSWGEYSTDSLVHFHRLGMQKPKRRNAVRIYSSQRQAVKLTAAQEVR